MTACRCDTSQSCRRVLTLILGCLLVNGALFASLYQHRKIQEIFEEDIFIPQEPIPASREVVSPAWSLLEETRAAIKSAGGVPGTPLSASERQAWEASRACASRQQLLPLWGREKRYTLSNKSAAREPSILLHALFEEYANLHRTCTHDGDKEYLAKLYKSPDESNNTRCKFLVVEFGAYGVGNRVLWLVSAYLYALLTKRVLLIDTRSTVHSLFCEPFPGSSWELPLNFPYSSYNRWPMPADFQRVWDAWENSGIDKSSVRKAQKAPQRTFREAEGVTDLDMHQVGKGRREMMASILNKIDALLHRGKLSVMDRHKSRKMVGIDRTLTAAELRNVPRFHRVQANDGWAPNPRFFCDNEQDRLHLVEWISLNSGCLYFLPNLFAIPSFQPVLEDLFPDRNPLTHLLRQVTLPVDSIWKKVQSLYNTEFESAGKVIGMQVRYREGLAMYRSLNDVVNERISICARDGGLIPDSGALPTTFATAGATRANNDSSGGPVVIFIASLYPGLRSHLQRIYEDTTVTTTNQTVKLLQLSKLGFQSFDLDGDCQAFTEIICLSLSDELMTSPQSTYGQIAQAYGGLTPWLIEFDPHASTNCVPGQSTDACYQLPVAKFSCPFDKELDGKAMSDVAPYLKPCQDTDGLQLVSPRSPALSPHFNSTL